MTKAELTKAIVATGNTTNTEEDFKYFSKTSLTEILSQITKYDCEFKCTWSKGGAYIYKK